MVSRVRGETVQPARVRRKLSSPRGAQSTFGGSPLEHGCHHVRHRSSGSSPGEELAQLGQGDVVGHRTLAALFAVEPVLAIGAVKELQIAGTLCGRQLPIQLAEGGSSSLQDSAVLGQNSIDANGGGFELSNGSLDAVKALLTARFLLGGAIMLAAAAVDHSPWRVARRDVGILALLGISNNALYLGLRSGDLGGGRPGARADTASFAADLLHVITSQRLIRAVMDDDDR